MALRKNRFSLTQLSPTELSVLESLKSGVKLTDALRPLIQNLIQAGLEGEMDYHLSEPTIEELPNRRNGKIPKTIKSSYGPLEISTPRDRNSDFEPQIVPKRSRSVDDSVAETILSLYSKGVSYSDIKSHFEKLYGLEISDGQMSAITDRIIPEMENWRNRPLKSCYAIIWLDAHYHKVRQDGKIVNKAIYVIFGINLEGRKDILGLIIGENEGAKYWLKVLNELKARGVEDILISCIDNLKGFAEAIEHVFPHTEVQLCLVHQMRNSFKYMSYKDSKEFCADLKEIYKAVSLNQAEQKFQSVKDKWGAQYGIVIKSWENNWERLTVLFQYPPDIRKLMYTTNPVEGFNRQMRKATKTKSAFVSDVALMKILYLATCNATEKWTMPIHNWNKILNALILNFGDRIEQYLKE